MLFSDVAVVPDARLGGDLADEVIASRGLELASHWCAGSRRRHVYARGLFRVVNGGGHIGVVVACSRCGQGRSLVPHDALRRHHLAVADLPLLEDGRTVRCERCDALGAELHHWAPQAIFGDADQWPTSYLCVECHRRWHQATRTA